jgi:hypothetical protein
VDDSVWKEVLDAYFEEFLEFFFPPVHRDIDWARRPVFLDKELQAILRGGPRGRQYADKLARVGLRGGGEAWVLLHVEVEGRGGPEFARRMYLYNHRFFERYGAEVVSLAVLTHAAASRRVRPFERRRWGFRLLFEFPAVKLSSYRGREEDLAGSTNPFALIVLAHLSRDQARGEPGGVFSAKRRLVRTLYDRGWRRDDVVRMFRFLDWLLELPPPLEDRFEGWMAEYEKRKTMPYVTSIERIGMRRGLQKGLEVGLEKGLQKGRTQELREAITAVLKARFGAKGRLLVAKVGLPGELNGLRRMHRSLVIARDFAAAKAVLERANHARKAQTPLT